VASESKILPLKDYILMQGIKVSSTLRIGMKNNKSSPRIVYKSKKQNESNTMYLKKRKIIKTVFTKILKKSTLGV
jgi:hypothetical protein